MSSLVLLDLHSRVQPPAPAPVHASTTSSNAPSDTLSLLLGGGMIGYAKGRSVDDHINRLRNGEKDLHHCKTVLDGEAGTSWGGHREKAESDIQDALKELDAAIAYRNSPLKHLGQ